MNRSLCVLSMLALVSFFSPLSSNGQERPMADLVLLNGRISTMNPENPEAEALAISGDRILAVGGNKAMSALARPGTRFMDLKKQRVVPGIIESHAHLMGLGTAAMKLDLVGTGSAAEIATLVRNRAAELAPGQWIQGRGWDQNDWPEKAFPTFEIISEAAPENPVFLTRVDGHAIWVNRKALDLAGVTGDTRDPAGGRIIRGPEGNPTGVFIDNAENLIAAVMPAMSRAEKKQALIMAMDQCLALGITGFHDAGAGQETLDLYYELLEEGALALRLNVMLSGGDSDLLKRWYARGPEIGAGKSRLTIRSVKLFADGALGSRGAALLEPYADEEGNLGLLITTEDEIFAVADQALAHGFQVCTHAIGDRGNRATLDGYERALKAHPEVLDARLRVEHAQILDKADIPRFARLGIIPAMQPTHCTSDMPWVPDRMGSDRTEEGAYVWRKLLDTGVPLPAGSDAPVESVNPLWGFYAAITRQDHEGRPPEGWNPSQRMTRHEALKAFTLDGAYAAFEEDRKGSLQKGKLADLTVLSRDIMTIPPQEILDTQVVMTMVGGKIAYKADQD